MKAMKGVRRFWQVLRNWNTAGELLNWETRRTAEATKLGEALDELDLPKRGGFPSDYAATEIGQALWLADQFGIELHIGTCFGDCRAVLPKERWLHPIAPDADQWSYSFYVRQDPAKVTSIQRISRWPEIAISQCVVNAKRAGVI